MFRLLMDWYWFFRKLRVRVDYRENMFSSTITWSVMINQPLVSTAKSKNCWPAAPSEARSQAQFGLLHQPFFRRELLFWAVVDRTHSSDRPLGVGEVSVSVDILDRIRINVVHFDQILPRLHPPLLNFIQELIQLKRFTTTVIIKDMI